MSIFTEPIHTLRGDETSLAAFDGQAILAVNVASKCGLTPQYTGLEALHETYAGQGFTVVGFPCNQFGGQEPGTAEEIESFCSTTYGVTFPMMEKIDVNGADRHPIYAALTEVADSEGHSGDIRWNFEKFLIGADGSVTRFGPTVTPEDPALVAAIEAGLPADHFRRDSGCAGRSSPRLSGGNGCGVLRRGRACEHDRQRAPTGQPARRPRSRPTVGTPGRGVWPRVV